MNEPVTVVEVGPRDGLQNECAVLTTEVKLAFVRALAAAGLSRIEVAAFVRPDRVPAMADAAEIFKAIAEQVFCLGDSPGAGSQMKLINQSLAGIHIAAAAEAMNLAQSLKMDLHQVIDVITHCAGTSWMFENRAPHIANGDYSPLSSVNIFVKDL